MTPSPHCHCPLGCLFLQTTACTGQRALAWIFVEKGPATGRSQSQAEVGLPWAAVKQLCEMGGLGD